MTHLIVLCHSFEHYSKDKEEIIFSLEYEKVTDIIKDCSLCDIYLDVEFSRYPTLTYIVLINKFIIGSFFERDNSFASVVFNIKKSRGPPSFKV